MSRDHCTSKGAVRPKQSACGRLAPFLGAAHRTMPALVALAVSLAAATSVVVPWSMAAETAVSSRLPEPAAARPRATPQAIEPLPPNKQLIVDFFGFTGSRDERASRFLAPDYIQHNPRFLRMDEITGARGNQAWVRAAEEAARRGVQLVALNGIPLRNPVIVLHEGDLAHAVYRGTRSDPASPGATRDIFAFESFRIRNGQFSEHWDQVRLVAGWMMSAAPAPTPTAGGRGAAGQGAAQTGAQPPAVPRPPPDCVMAPGRLSANKELVRALFNGSLSPDAIQRRLASDFVDHSPRGLLRARGVGAVAPRPRALDHVVADCDFVSVVWKEVVPDPDNALRSWEAFTFDTFRLRNDEVVEHWDQTLP